MDAEVGVIGLGTMGSMALWQLARKGISVIGFEQFGIGHDMSAAGGESRLFRTIYKEGEEYVPLLKQSYELWRELEDESGKEILTITSGLIIGDFKLNSMKSALRSINAHDLDFEIYEGREARIKYPQYHLEPNESIIVDKVAGYLRPQQAIISAIEVAKELGAAIHTFSKVKSIRNSEEGVHVITEDREYKVNKLLLSVGPWSNTFLGEINNHIEVRRLINCWFLPRKNSELTQLGLLPFTREKENVSYYGFPPLDGQMVKIGIFSTEKEKIEGPNFCDKNIKLEEVAPFTKIVQEDLPGLHPYPSRVNAYMDGFTRDKYPIIGKMPDANNITILSGFSGHGFKMAPAIGKQGVELVLEGKVEH